MASYKTHKSETGIDIGVHLDELNRSAEFRARHMERSNRDATEAARARTFALWLETVIYCGLSSDRSFVNVIAVSAMHGSDITVTPVDGVAREDLSILDINNLHGRADQLEDSAAIRAALITAR